MGGMNARYVSGRGATGDLTGGGGRSVMPNRDLINNVIARRQRMLEARRRGPAPPARQAPYGPLAPPGGGYSGGVIPRFQTGGQMLTAGPPQAPSPPSPSNFRYGFEHSGNYPWMPQSWQDRMAGLRTSVSARSLPQKLQQFQTRSGPNVTDILKEQPAWWPESARGWRAWQIPRRGIEGHSVGVAPTGTRNLSGSGGRGGYSGGVVPRFQGGGAPRAGGAPRRTGYAPSSYQSPFDQYGRAWGFKRRHLGQSFDPRVQTKATQYALQNYWGQPPGGG